MRPGHHGGACLGLLEEPGLLVPGSLHAGEFPRMGCAGNWVYENGQNDQPCPPVKKVLCSALVYTPRAELHRTNSPATRLQQPVAPRNKSSQHTLPYTPVAGRIRPIYASHTPL